MTDFETSCGNALVGGATGASVGGSVGAAVGAIGGPLTSALGATIGGAIGSVPMHSSTPFPFGRVSSGSPGRERGGCLP